MTLTDDVARQIGSMLWRGSFGERRAIGIFGRLRRGALLTDAEREPLERIMDEEVDHGNLLRSCARRYLALRPDIPRPMFPAHRTPEHILVAALNAAERFEMPGLSLAHALFQRLGDADAVWAYTRLIADEPGHIAWGRQVLDRLRRTRPELRADLSAVRRPLVRAYKAARTHRWFLRGEAAADPYPEGEWGGAPHALRETRESSGDMRPAPATVPGVGPSHEMRGGPV